MLGQLSEIVTMNQQISLENVFEVFDVTRFGNVRLSQSISSFLFGFFFCSNNG